MKGFGLDRFMKLLQESSYDDTIIVMKHLTLFHVIITLNRTQHMMKSFNQKKRLLTAA